MAASFLSVQATKTSCDPANQTSPPNTNGHFLVYAAAFLDGKLAFGCPNEKADMIGFAPHWRANREWFEAGKGRYDELRFLNDGLWHNFRCVDQRPHTLRDLVIENENGICNLGDLTFKRQGDGTFKGASSNTEEVSMCHTDCQWPGTDKEFENCTNVTPRCLLSCTGNFCLPPSSTVSTAPPPSDAPVGAAEADSFPPETSSSCDPSPSFGGMEMDLITVVDKAGQQSYYALLDGSSNDVAPRCEVLAEEVLLSGDELPTAKWSPPSDEFRLETVKDGKLCKGKVSEIVFKKHCDGFVALYHAKTLQMLTRAFCQKFHIEQ